MNSQDPLEILQAHYERLDAVPTPLIRIERPIRWWEAVGGLAAGAAVVVIAVTICLNTSVSTAPTRGLMEHQMRMAGLKIDGALPPKRAQRRHQWHV